MYTPPPKPYWVGSEEGGYSSGVADNLALPHFHSVPIGIDVDATTQSTFRRAANVVGEETLGNVQIGALGKNAASTSSDSTVLATSSAIPMRDLQVLEEHIVGVGDADH